MFNQIIVNNNYVIDTQRCTKIEGLSYTSADIQSEVASNGIGALYSGSVINTRDIVIEFDVSIENADTDMRYFEPSKFYELRIDQRKINAVCKLSELVFSEDYESDPTLVLEFEALDPFFYDVETFNKNIAGVFPQFGFPWTATVEDGITFGYKIFTKETVFENNGDYDVGFKIQFKANEIAQNISFANLSSNKFIQVNIDMVRNDVLEISSVKNDKYIRLNGENVFKNLDRRSGYFDLIRGDNFLVFDADVGSEDLDVFLSYTPAYRNGVVVR